MRFLQSSRSGMACEVLDDAHGLSAAGTVPGCAVRQGRQRQGLAVLCGEQCACQGQQLFSEAVREQAIATDAHESLWQHVQKEAAQELHGFESHDALLAAMGIIPPAEADVLSVEGDEAVVADGHAVGVTAEVAQDMFRSSEGRLSVDVPVLLLQLVDQLLEARRITEISGWTTAMKQALAVELAESDEELLAKDGAQEGNRE